MSKGISLITLTGGREESFSRCSIFVNRFYRPIGVPIQWIIVDDCSDKIPEIHCVHSEMNYILPRNKWKPGANTQATNLLEAIDCVKYDCIIFIEDDDWYSADHVFDIYSHLKDSQVSIVGEIPSRYYHVPTQRYRVMENIFYASLCQTAVKDSVLPYLRKVCLVNSDMLDWHLWSNSHMSKKTIKTKNCVGMKGLPGRPGIGIGHRPDNNPSWKSDASLVTLRQWIEDDVQFYAQNLPLLSPYNALQTPR